METKCFGCDAKLQANIKLVDQTPYLFTYDNQTQTEYRQDIYKKSLVELLKSIKEIPQGDTFHIRIVMNKDILNIGNSSNCQSYVCELSIRRDDLKKLKDYYDNLK